MVSEKQFLLQLETSLSSQNKCASNFNKAQKQCPRIHTAALCTLFEFIFLPLLVTKLDSGFKRAILSSPEHEVLMVSYGWFHNFLISAPKWRNLLYM